MLVLSIGDGFVVYTVGLLMLVAGMALYDLWKQAVRQWEPSRERLVECSDCSRMFISERQNTVIRCPRCNALCSGRRK